MKKLLFIASVIVLVLLFFSFQKSFVNASICDNCCPGCFDWPDCPDCPTCPGCPTKSPTPTETSTTSPTPTPAETPEETLTPTPTSTPGGAPFNFGGPPPPPDVEEGQVLGATTLGATGV